MKASEMTNEELASELDNVLVNDELQAFADVEHQQEVKREAARRLRNITVRTDNSAVIAEVIAELQRRIEKQKEVNKELVCENVALHAKLKVAEDALENVIDAFRLGFEKTKKGEN